MTTGRIAFLCFVIFLLCTGKVSAGDCPCKFKANGLRYVTSAKPIPAAHARCLAPINGWLAWTKATEAKLSNAMLAKSMLQATFSSLSGIDWGVPPAEDAKEMLADASKRLAAAEKETAKSPPAPAKQSGKVKDKMEQAFDLELAALEEEERLLDELSRRQDEAQLAYAKCVVANNLPPTAK